MWVFNVLWQSSVFFHSLQLSLKLFVVHSCLHSCQLSKRKLSKWLLKRQAEDTPQILIMQLLPRTRTIDESKKSLHKIVCFLKFCQRRCPSVFFIQSGDFLYNSSNRTIAKLLQLFIDINQTFNLKTRFNAQFFDYTLYIWLPELPSEKSTEKRNDKTWHSPVTLINSCFFDIL